VGVGLVNDCSIGACFSAGVVGCGFRGGVDRGSQLARRHPILKSNLVNPTFAEHPMEQPERRQAFLSRLGLGLTAAFVVIRAINIYGDPFPWSARKKTPFSRFFLF
jgi:hypothetical protein